MKLTMQEKDNLLTIAVDLCENMEGLHRMFGLSKYLEMQQNFYGETEDSSEAFLRAFVEIVQLYEDMKEKVRR